ncbi:RagB/SusD family nutrient uptake outer membrane protein [Pedobacter cryoconitis]|uniref:SusD-like starch-binding protein associating with outer membrane n=1 Tax=Pedobacter cryoconitis TaxID=188932 RepID=A0A327S274_9SPHI|nr:RagB/SusD family nutrient uptake outer membrane protein [Pedobacter cryoconitis]RAJ22392.1 SusD-like starch-binding protein associating with outer membrane [Pedobacter cryoconitis]
MNYRNYIYSLLLVAIIGTSSCTKLDEKPYGLTNTGSFYKTAADAKSAVIYAYSILPEVGYYSRGYYIITELPTENLSQKGDAGVSNFELDQLRTTSTNSDLDNIWTYLYRGISRANAVIINVPGIENMSATDKNQIVGEGHFLRALHYFNLVRLFGEVPLRTETLADVSQIPAEKSPVSKVYDLIISDLKSAEELMLPAKNDEGRANKAAAQALLAKVYLQLASAKTSSSPKYEFVADASAMYDQAKIYAGKVINEQSNFVFTNNLPDIWNTEVYKKTASEHIFDAAVDRTGEIEGNYSKLTNMFLAGDRPMTILYDANNPASASINIGQGWGHFLTEAAHYNGYPTNDKRKSQLIVSTYVNDGKVYNLDIASSSRPFSRKFIDPLRIGDKTSCNSPVIRYSDILLVYAEASGPTADGYAAVNKVRSRAGLGILNPALGLQEFRDAVVLERSWELAFEGNRLFDLRRTNTMEKVLVQQYGKTITSGAYFFPIPQRELDTNPLMKP